MPNSGKSKSANVKISKVTPIRVALGQKSAQFPATQLLCRKLRCPVEVAFSTTMPRLAALWRPIRSLWEQNYRAEACSLMAETTPHAAQDASRSIPTLFLLAQMRMDHGDTVGGERCLQSAVRQLGLQTNMRAKPPSRVQSRISTADVDASYALCDRDWLILAIQALLKDDIESCLLWIRQADPRLFETVGAAESPQRLRLVGDLHAILACVAAQTDELEEAEKLLVTAYEKHVQVEAFQAVCRDLILTARLAMLQGQFDRTQTLLDAAECQLVLALHPDEADRSPLMSIIYSDRMQFAETLHDTHVRRWCRPSK